MVLAPTKQGLRCKPEVAGVTFSDSDSVPVPKFLNPVPVSSENSDLSLFVSYLLLGVKE